MNFISQFKINPCRGCAMRYGHRGGDINEFTDCCYNTCSAIPAPGDDGYGSRANFENSPCIRKCRQCIDNMIYKRGKTPYCSLRIKSPLIRQRPHYFTANLIKKSRANASYI